MSHNTMIQHCIATAVLLTAFLPLFLHAEGAVRVLSCEITEQCDAAAQCQPYAEAVEFRMEPQTLNADGSGEFILRYRDSEAPMQALSEIGPFVWTQAEDRYTLLASSETRFLLHKLALGGEPQATIQFLRCSLRQ